MLIVNSSLARISAVHARRLVFLTALVAPGVIAQNSSSPVIVATAQQTEVFEEVPLTGTVVSSREARLSPEISGLIESIDVEIFGGSRSAGQDISKQPVHEFFNRDQMGQDLADGPLDFFRIDLLLQLFRGESRE